MFSTNETDNSLRAIGERLRSARLSKGDSQSIFAARIGVSVPTLRDMERGSASVAIGSWVAALWALSRLRELDGLLQQSGSLFAQLEQPARGRIRAPRRSRISA